jgi:hypothetical protein
MKTKILSATIILVILSLTLSACGAGQMFGPTVTPVPTATSTPMPTPTFTATPSLPTYNEVISTYPNASLCHTEAQIVAQDADGNVSLSGKISFSDAAGMIYQCYGTKILVGVPVVLDGVSYPQATLLTVDKNKKWIAVSSW